MLIAHVLLQLGAGGSATIPALVQHASAFSKIVLLVLLALSVYSWAVIWNRLRLYATVSKQDAAFLAAFRQLPPEADLKLTAAQHPVSVLARTALAGQRTLETLPPEQAGAAARYELSMHAMDRAANDELSKLETNVGFLATTGSVAPFIGLLGTVWGVMISFVNIGAQGSATLVVVAPGIAEALIATIAGLAAAIPSVIGYNHCLQRLRDTGNAATQFAGEFLDRRIGAHLK
jgi:biopolymer transport protein TolQ